MAVNRIPRSLVRFMSDASFRSSPVTTNTGNGGDSGKRTGRLKEGGRRNYPFESVARRKLRMLNNASTLDDLRIPPANRLEVLKGGRKGQHSIRINDQWRIA